MSKLRTPLSKIDDYPVYLNNCWQLHLRERNVNAPTVISTFAGCGGSSLGYSMAGFRELLAIEWDKNAAETFKLNFINVPIIQNDITKISVEQIFEITKLNKYELDILDGSPPCQGFSTAGKRKFNDRRNELYKEYIRLLNDLQPKAFVMENVSGMVKGKMKLIFADILNGLKSCGYRVSVRLLNAMYYGVPQSRNRLIFIGFRNDLDIEPSHPEPKYKPIKVIDAWGGKYLDGENHYLKESSVLYKYVSQIKPGKSASDIHPIRHYYSKKRLDFNKSSQTVTKHCCIDLFHPEENRNLNINELKRLGSFPDDFRFIDNYHIAAGQIGNSVPPLFMMEIAKYVREQLE